MTPLSFILFLLGVILLIVEIAIPGFGFPGIIGLICLFIGSMIIASSYGVIAMIIAFTVLVFIIGIFIYLIKKHNIYKKIILEDKLEEKGFDESILDGMIGARGVVIADLRPAGKADFDGKILEVFSAVDYIPRGTSVIITEIKGKDVIVRQII